MPKGDELFQKALGFARRDAVLAFLDRQGIKASRFFADVKIEGTQSNVRLDYNVSRDTIPPKLNVEWTPPKGSKVKAGDRITAKAVARDDANLWQTGIKTIDLTLMAAGSLALRTIRSRRRLVNAYPRRGPWTASTPCRPIRRR